MIEEMEKWIGDPSRGLPEEVFLFLSRITPIINVDLLIKDERNRTLLTWRDDADYPAGWHVPGGIIRYKETFADRIHAVAQNELGAKVTFANEPIALNQVIHPSRRDRGHFISLLYDCRLTSPLLDSLQFRGEYPQAGEWAWHTKCPADLILVHEMYRSFLS